MPDTSEAPTSLRQYSVELGISEAALDLYLDSEVIDLHIDSFIWHRVFGYDLTKRHGSGLLAGLCYSQVDIPRILEARITGATWVITTNPARDARDREDVFHENLATLTRILNSVEQIELCTTAADYWKARARGKHAAWIGVQGGNALDRELSSLTRLPLDSILRVTLVHLLPSRIGQTSSPLRLSRNAGLSEFGKRYVEQLDALRIFVDLAHISKQGFWDAVAVHDADRPLLVSHTGVSGVHAHWRNLDDDQLRAVADSGGVVGIMYHSEFLGDSLLRGRIDSVLEHMEHVIELVGSDYVALGSDWDGAIFPPRALRSCTRLPLLVDAMLRRGWPVAHIRKALGLNFLRALEQLRG